MKRDNNLNVGSCQVIAAAPFSRLVHRIAAKVESDRPKRKTLKRHRKTRSGPPPVVEFSLMVWAVKEVILGNKTLASASEAIGVSKHSLINWVNGYNRPAVLETAEREAREESSRCCTQA